MAAEARHSHHHIWGRCFSHVRVWKVMGDGVWLPWFDHFRWERCHGR